MSRTRPDNLCITLREMAQRYLAPCPFKPGDLVQPRRDSGAPDSEIGRPQIVLEVADSADERLKGIDESACAVVKIAFEDQDGDIATAWVEAWKQEPYSGPVATVAEAA